MNIKNLQRKKMQKSNVMLSIRITSNASKWIREKNFSPTAIFKEALIDLGYKEE